MEERPTHSRQKYSVTERRREVHTMEEEETSESSTVANSMEALQKSMTLPTNSMLMEREARKWEDKKRKSEMEKKEIKDKELMEIENERYEARTKLEEANLEAIRTAEIVAKEREWKRQQVLSSLQKVDQTTDPEAYLSSFELFMREDAIPEREWPAILRKEASGRIMEVMMDLDLTISYQSIKLNILEHLGHTQAKARRQTWTSKPGDNQSPQSFLAPIVRNIQRLSKDRLSQKDFVKELFLGVLTLHYSAEVCHGPREKDIQTVDQLVADLEASWESRLFTARI